MLGGGPPLALNHIQLVQEALILTGMLQCESVLLSCCITFELEIEGDS